MNSPRYVTQKEGVSLGLVWALLVIQYRQLTSARLAFGARGLVWLEFLTSTRVLRKNARRSDILLSLFYFIFLCKGGGRLKSFRKKSQRDHLQPKEEREKARFI
jgi:hypothetical protein